VKIQPIAWGIVHLVNQIVPVLARLEFPAQVGNVRAVLSPAVEPAMTNVLKTVNALPVPSAIFLFYSKESLIFSRLI
jgi:hypothetical protein